MLRRSRSAAQTSHALQQERIHGNRNTIRHQRGLVMFINLMRFQLADIFIRNLISIHLRQLVNHQQTVHSDHFLLWQFTHHRSNVLAFYVGIRVNLTASRCVLSGFVLVDKVQVLAVPITICFYSFHARAPIHVLASLKFMRVPFASRTGTCVNPIESIFSLSEQTVYLI